MEPDSKRRTFSVVAAAATAAENGAQGAVSPHAVEQGDENGQPAAGEYARVENVPARSQNEQDDENPKAAIALQTAIHSFSSLIAAGNM